MVPLLGVVLLTGVSEGADATRPAPARWQEVAVYRKKDFHVTPVSTRVATPGWATQQPWRVRLSSPTKECYVMVITSLGDRVSLTEGPNPLSHHYPPSASFSLPTSAVGVTSSNREMEIPADMKLVVEQLAPPGRPSVAQAAGTSASSRAAAAKGKSVPASPRAGSQAREVGP